MAANVKMRVRFGVLRTESDFFESLIEDPARCPILFRPEDRVGKVLLVKSEAAIQVEPTLREGGSGMGPGQVFSRVPSHFVNTSLMALSFASENMISE
jgi:hypothetical protein